MCSHREGRKVKTEYTERAEFRSNLEVVCQ